MRRARSWAIALIAATAIAGCTAPIDGTPVVGPKDVDQGYFFAGDVALYGQHVSADDATILAYLRALRRIDVCGLLTGEALARVGETLSVGTLFAFDECDAELKVSGDTARRFVSAELSMSPTPGSSCDQLVPLKLDRLPGARQLTGSSQPSVKVGLIGAEDCELSKRIADAIASRLATTPLPARDAAATYWSWLAERDPCEVLSVLPDPVTRWDVPGSRPYACGLTVLRAERSVPLQVRLEPQAVESSTEGRLRIDRDGFEVYLDLVSCSAASFVDAPMERKVVGRGYVGVSDVVIRPAVAVDGAGRDCDVTLDVATQAAKLYR